MFLNYIKLAYRNLLAHKWVSAINIFGLSIAIGCSITVFLFLHNHWTLDNFHVHGDRIFMVEYRVDKNGEEQIWGTSPMPLGPALANDFPQVEHAVRVDAASCKVYREDHVFDERICFVDTGFFGMFSFPLKSGSPEALADPNAVILSAELAEKYFKGEDAMGKAITLVFANQAQRVFTVRGVAEPFPENTGFQFEVLAGFSTLGSIRPDRLTDWGAETQGTFVQLRQASDVDILAQKMGKYAALYNAANPELPIKSFVFDNLRHPNPGAYDVYQRPAEAAHPLVTLIFSLMAVLMMALSCFNYINISLGFVGKRLKEIGVRKAIGGKKSQLVWQFMSENLLLCLLALLVGLALTQTVLVPLFNAIMVMKISLSFAANPWLWVFLPGLLVFTGMASGAYPAFYVSRFQAVSIFKGKQQFSGKKGLTRVLLALQFVLAFSTVIIGTVLLRAGAYWEKMSWGYQPENILILRLENAGQYSFLRNEAERNPHITRIAGAVNHVGESFVQETLTAGNDKMDAVRYDVGAGYFEAMGLQLEAGRFFDPQLRNEDARVVVVNQRFVQEREWTNAIGQELRSEGKVYRVTGVVEDFKIMGSGATRPVVFHRGEEDSFGYLALQYEAGSGKQVEDFMRSTWQRLYPGTPLNFFYQKNVFENFYQSYGNVATAFGYIAGLALLIACLGLFGLATQNFASRLKEVSLRKIMGASTANIILLVNQGFFLLLLIASIMATTFCYAGIRVLMHSVEVFTGAMTLGVVPYLIGNILVFATACFAIGGQTYKLTKADPVAALRTE